MSKTLSAFAHFLHTWIIQDFNFSDVKKGKWIMSAPWFLYPPPCWPLILPWPRMLSDTVPLLPGGLRPPQAIVLPYDWCLPHLLLGGKPCQFPECTWRMGARAAGIRTQCPLPAHWHPGKCSNALATPQVFSLNSRLLPILDFFHVLEHNNCYIGAAAVFDLHNKML